MQMPSLKRPYTNLAYIPIKQKCKNILSVNLKFFGQSEVVLPVGTYHGH
jgi:hypothetical protein